MAIGGEGGIRTFSDNEADQANEDYYPIKYKILQQEIVGENAVLHPANLEDGYYPKEYFRSITFAADIVRDGEEIKPKPSRHYYEYVGAEEGQK